MKALIFIFLLLSTTLSFAQQQSGIETLLKTQLGGLMFNNAVLAADNEKLQARVVELEKKLKEAIDAKQKPGPSPTDGGGGAQP